MLGNWLTRYKTTLLMRRMRLLRNFFLVLPSCKARCLPIPDACWRRKAMTTTAFIANRAKNLAKTSATCKIPHSTFCSGGSFSTAVRESKFKFMLHVSVAFATVSSSSHQGDVEKRLPPKKGFKIAMQREMYINLLMED